MKKRMLSLMLVSVMVTGLLVGCGKDEPLQKESSETKQSESEKMDEAEASSEVEEEVSYEPVTLKLLVTNGREADQDEDWWLDYPVGQKLYNDLQELGITLEFEEIAPDAFDSVVNTRMVTGLELPDLICFGWGDANIVNTWGEEGLVYSANEFVELYDEDGSIRAFYDEKAPGAWAMSSTADGEKYYFDYLYNSATTAIDATSGKELYSGSFFDWLIRKDFVEAVGEELKPYYTLEEFAALLKKMRDEDANGNGVADEIIQFDYSGLHGFKPAFGLPMGLFGLDGGTENMIAAIKHENYADFVMYINDLYNHGVYDPVMMTASNNEMVASERLIAHYDYQANTRESRLPYYDEADLETKYYEDIHIDPDGDLSNGFPVYVDSMGVTAYTPWVIPKSTEHPEAIARLLDYIYTDEYACMCQYGVEGEDGGYVVDENGYVKITPTDDNDNDRGLESIGMAWRYMPNMVVMGTVKDGQRKEVMSERPKVTWFCINDYEIRSEYMWSSLENNTVFYGSYANAPATQEEQEIIDKYLGTLNTYYSELTWDFILGRKSVDDLDTYIAEMEELGLSEVLEVYQNRYDRANGK